jgi:hypothetical protein
MGKRLNDTAGLVGGDRRNEGRVSISTRKIDNGWIVERSASNPNTGEWRCSEEYQKSLGPVVGVGDEGLAGAKKALGCK